MKNRHGQDVRWQTAREDENCLFHLDLVFMFYATSLQMTLLLLFASGMDARIEKKIKPARLSKNTKSPDRTGLSVLHGFEKISLDKFGDLCGC